MNLDDAEDTPTEEVRRPTESLPPEVEARVTDAFQVRRLLGFQRYTVFIFWYTLV